MPKEKYDGEPGTEGQLKEYSVAVEWKMRGTVRVRATSLNAAVEATHELPLPRGEYIDDSFESLKNDDETNFERYCDADEKPSLNPETGEAYEKQPVWHSQ